MSCPSGKCVYASPAEAARAVELITRRNRHGNPKARQRNGAGRLSHYRCRMCGEWHIGHALKGAA